VAFGTSASAVTGSGIQGVFATGAPTGGFAITGFASGGSYGQNDEDMSSSPNRLSPMHAGQSDSEEMGDQSPASDLPFGMPVMTTPPTTTTGWPSRIPRKGDRASLNSIPETVPSTTEDAGESQSDKKADADRKLAELKAKLAEKKKRLEEKRRKGARSTSPKLNANAAPFVPGNASLAERNALRFAGDTGRGETRAMLPAELRSKADEDATAQNALRNAGGRGEREDLENATSLVGTCPHMCPDEELLRREREGDIQLLERPVPGEVHPQNWTLRDTMVKRFRRSAADYKLDVPEWVRPPDVLEKVCGYLEEWVMVSFKVMKWWWLVWRTKYRVQPFAFFLS
jgi:hypothetical protein